jgi:hypothetical protein
MNQLSNDSMPTKIVEDFEEKEENDEVKKSLQDARIAYDFKMLRNPKTNKVPRMAAMEAMKTAKREQQERIKAGARFNATLPTINIDVRGPSNYGGRTRSLVFDSRNNMIGVAGGVSGGIFRTTDGGGSWTSVTPAGQIHNVTTIAQDRSSGNENYWYAGGGEQKGNSSSANGATYYGNGVWRSSDNGQTWSLLNSTTQVLESFDSDWDFVHRIIVDPSNGYVYAGNSGGLFRSTDRGNSWTQVLGASSPNSETMTEIIRNDNGVFYAAISGQGIYRSTTGANNSWSLIADGNDLDSGFDRIILAHAPSNNNIIYAFYNTSAFSCNGSTSQVRLRRWDNTSNGGAGAWTGNYDNVISNCANTSLTLDPQGGYNLALAVRPNNENEVFIGGERLYRLTITGTNTGTYAFAGGDQGNPTATNLHVDQHWLVFTGNDTLWVTNDGGIRRGDVSVAPNAQTGFNWTNRNSGLITYQFYRGDITPNMGSDMVGGGAQDNANNIIPHGTTNGTELGGGDGVQFAIISGTGTGDYITLTGTQNGSINRRSAPNTSGNITPWDGNNVQWQGFNTFFVLDGDNTDHCYYPIRHQEGTDSKAELFRTRGIKAIGTNVSIGNDPTSEWQRMTLGGMVANQDISAMGLSRNVGFNNSAYSASDSNRKLYIGTDAGKVYRTTDPAFASSLTLTDITPSNVANGSYVSDIAVNPYDDKELLVTLSNYGVSSIYHTTDATAGTVSWTEVEGTSSGAVAKSSVRSAMIAKSGQNTLYIIGTSTGLYGTTMLNGASTAWERIGGTKIAYALCVDMRLRTSDNKFALATHGNGLFLLSIVSNNSCVATLTLDDNPITANTYQTSDSIVSAGRVASGSTVVMDAKNSVILKPNFTAEQGSNFTAQIGGCNASLVTETETFASIDQFIETELVKEKKADVEFSLYPSPASGTVTIDYFLDQATEAVITLHSSTGNLVKVLQSNTALEAGTQQLTFEAGDFHSGLYYVVISTPNVRKTQKLMVQRN